MSVREELAGFITFADFLLVFVAAKFFGFIHSWLLMDVSQFLTFGWLCL
jgi:hypothetical protein